VLLDENAFSALERPEEFFDSLHLNAHGRAVFSRELAGLIRETLAH
jgi:lysophospholipase L1-like esterase